jgi:Tol biopolymer transport system component
MVAWAPWLVVTSLASQSGPVLTCGAYVSDCRGATAADWPRVNALPYETVESQLNAIPAPSDGAAVLIQRDSRHAGSSATVDVSGDGRFVAAESLARLLPLDTNNVSDIYVLDRVSSHLTLESVAISGESADGTSTRPRLSEDGRYVVFESIARNLVSGFRGGVVPRVFLRDRHKGTTTLVAPPLEEGVKWAGHPDISDDGRFVVFETTPVDRAPATSDREPGREVFRFDAERHAIARISVDSAGLELPGSSVSPALSGDGRHVAFTSTAALDREAQTSRKPGSHARQIFVRDTVTGTTRLVSRSRSGRMADRRSSFAAISADGRFIAFASMARDLVGDDRNDDEDVFLRDMLSGRTVLVSRSAAGGSANGRSYHPAISGDGRFITFVSTASDLMCARRCPFEHTDLNLVSDIYLFDRIEGIVTRISGSQAGLDPWWEASAGPAIDFSGQVVAFSSTHATDAADLGHDFDAFIRILGGPQDPKRPTVAPPRVAAAVIMPGWQTP